VRRRQRFERDDLIAVRRARTDEAAAARALVRGAYGHYVERIGREPGPMGDDYAARIADGQVWVLDDDSAMAGLVVIEKAAGCVLLDNIAVARDFWGRGHGRRLMNFVEDRAREMGRSEIRLYTHVLMTENIAMYRRLGFVELERKTEKGFDRVYMAKSLTPPRA
jgi:ribosomal protein S18 acetylase RimI-like enzyme